VGAAANPGWLLWANGYLAQRITVPQSGTYLFRVTAHGSPALGGWPNLTAEFDGSAEDRNLVLDRVSLTPEFAARLISARADLQQHLPTLQWGAFPGRSYAAFQDRDQPLLPNPAPSLKRPSRLLVPKSLPEDETCA
jgi:hypothetical protein